MPSSPSPATVQITGFPVSSLFEVRETEHSGRGVSAIADIKKGTRLLETSTPVAWVIYDEYVKEVCAQCFAYDRGKTWKIRDPSKGVVFCSPKCQEIWIHDIPTDQSLARDTIQRVLRRKRRAFDQLTEKELEVRRKVVDSEHHWHTTELLADEIRSSRGTSSPTKKQRKLLQAAQDDFVEFVQDPYVVWYMFEGLIHPITHPESWACMQNLVADTAPYKALGDLARSTQAYILLLSIVPLSILPWITQTAVRSLQAHSTHNVFGLRSLDEGGEDGDAGAECFGYGLWPVASFWNHSCRPNVQKRRVGRSWEFWACADIRVGEELCISYLGGDERDIGGKERRERLKEVWGFDCGCVVCRDDGNTI